jgi:hypothetical protein
MANDAKEREVIGEIGHQETSRSRRARATHHRRYAAEIHAIAEDRPAGAIRDRLMALAGEYEALARIVGRYDRRAASSDATVKRRPGREKLASAAPS